MIDQQELPPKTHARVIDQEEIDVLDQWGISSSLAFDPEILGFSNWQQMLNSTQADGDETQAIIYWDGKTLSTDGVIKGHEVKNWDKPAKNKDQIFHFPSVRRSLLSRLRPRQRLVEIHTHHKPPEYNHILTTPLSDSDVNNFLGSSLKAFGMIDIGGVHILARVPYSSHFADSETDQPINPVKQGVKFANKNRKLAIEIMEETARRIKPLGLRYYFSPKLTLNEKGLIEVTDVLR